MSFPDYSLYIFIAKLLMLFETSFSDTCFYEYISFIMNFVFVLSLDVMKTHKLRCLTFIYLTKQHNLQKIFSRYSNLLRRYNSRKS